ncbi:hypothetical protein [Halobacteriovorax sp. CON-3]
MNNEISLNGGDGSGGLKLGGEGGSGAQFTDGGEGGGGAGGGTKVFSS